MKIALLEDEDAQAERLLSCLVETAHECKRFATGHDFIKGVSAEQFDLYVLDWVLPDITGEDVLLWLRNQYGTNRPILFLTSMSSQDHIVRALEQGADDYLVKPVQKPEFLARLNALERRYQIQKPQERTDFGRFSLNPQRRAALLDGADAKMTEREFDVALYLVKHQGELVSRANLLAAVWGTNPEINTRTVDTHVSRVRVKLGLYPENGWRLSSIYGHGYRLERLTDEASSPL